MRSQLFILFAFIIPSAVFAQDYYKEGFLVIKGQVKEPKSDLLQVWVANYFRGLPDAIRIKPDGSFEKKIPVQHEQNISLRLNNEQYSFTVVDGDTLDLSWNDADFANTFSIRGKNTIRTNELQLQLKLQPLAFSGFIDLRNVVEGNTGNLSYCAPVKTVAYLQIQQIAEAKKKLVAEEKYELINRVYNQHVKTLLESAKFSNTLVDHFLTNLYFQYANLLWEQQLVPKYQLKLALDSSTKWFFPNGEELLPEYTMLNENWFRSSPEYRRFIDNYLRFYKPFNQFVSLKPEGFQHQGMHEDYYLAKATIPVVNIQEWFIANNIMWGFEGGSFLEVEQVYRDFMNTCTSAYLKKTLVNYYTAIKHLKPGSPAPGFTLKNDQGQEVSLSKFRGKVIYLDFWGVHCPPCIADIKNHVPRLHKKYKDKDVVFINICVDSKEKEWKEALAKYQLDGINLIAEGRNSNPVCRAYNIDAIPHYILIDKNGRIADNNAKWAYELNAATGKNAIDLLLK